jgi:hypothetical protein
MSDIEKVFDDFADATEATLLAYRKELTDLKGEIGSALTEMRSLKADLETRSAPQVVEGPAGKDGRDGVDGKDGIDGKDGRDGTDGTPGERGTDGINGRDGTPGERGADGVATREEIEDIATRAVETRFAEVQTRTFADIYQGTFDPKQNYTRGLTATYDGSLWLSERDTNKQPGTIDSGWKLITKRGRDGRDRK